MYKYSSFYNGKIFEGDFKITPVKDTLRENIIIYKGTIIKGWSGEFYIDAPCEILKLPMEQGLEVKILKDLDVLNLFRR